MEINNIQEFALYLDRHWGRCEAQTASEVNLERINEGIGRHGSWGLCVRLFQKNGRSYIKHENVNRKTDGAYLSHCIPDYDATPDPIYLPFPFTNQEFSKAVDKICQDATDLYEECKAEDEPVDEDNYDDRQGENLLQDSLRYP